MNMPEIYTAQVYHQTITHKTTWFLCVAKYEPTSVSGKVLLDVSWVISLLILLDVKPGDGSCNIKYQGFIQMVIEEWISIFGFISV